MNIKRFLKAVIILLLLFGLGYMALLYVGYGKYRSKLINSNFSFNRIGWVGTLGEIKREENGNRYAVNDYNWGFSQMVSVEPGNSYALSAKTKKGTSTQAARIAAIFYNSRDEQEPVSYLLNYWHRGSGWESIPPQVINAPQDATSVRIYLLALGEHGNHLFDNIRLNELDHHQTGAPFEVNINQPEDQPEVNEQRTGTSILKEPSWQYFPTVSPADESPAQETSSEDQEQTANPNASEASR